MVNYRAETRFVRKHSFLQKPHFRFLRKCDEKIQHEITHIAIMYNFFYRKCVSCYPSSYTRWYISCWPWSSWQFGLGKKVLISTFFSDSMISVEKSYSVSWEKFNIWTWPRGNQSEGKSIRWKHYRPTNIDRSLWNYWSWIFFK